MMHKRIMTLMMMVFMASLHASGQEWKIIKPYVTNGVDFRLHEMSVLETTRMELEKNYLKSKYNCKGFCKYLNAIGRQDRIPQVIKTDKDQIASMEELNQLITSQTTEYSKLKLELHSVNNNSSLHEICEKIAKSNSEMELIKEARMKLLKSMNDHITACVDAVAKINNTPA